MDILRDKNLRVTPFRKEVLEIFLENEHAISIQDIEEALVEFDRITLYRTIKSFTNKGVIHEIECRETLENWPCVIGFVTMKKVYMSITTFIFSVVCVMRFTVLKAMSFLR